MRIQHRDDQIIFWIPKSKEINIDALNMLAVHSEHSLCTCSYAEVKRQHCITYSTPWKKERENVESKIVIAATISLLEMVQKNQLDVSNFCLRRDCIFINEAGGCFIFLPLIAKKKVSIKKFVMQFLKVLKQTKIRTYSDLKALREDATVEDVIDCLSKDLQDQVAAEHFVPCDGEGETTILSKAGAEESETTILSGGAAEAECDTVILSQHTTVFVPDEKAECETTFLTDDDVECETTFLSNDIPANVYPVAGNQNGTCELYLLRTSTGELIHINRTEFSIGKDYSSMNYVLGNESVSRNHATIFIEGDSFYLRDNGSTNGTVMEGVRLQQGEKAEMDDGYIVSFGNELFQVLIERKG